MASPVNRVHSFALRAFDLFYDKQLVVHESNSSGNHLVAAAFYPEGDLFIRADYVKMYASIEAKLDSQTMHGGGRAGGRVIWGQPGIGKSAFLFYALAVALSTKRSVAWCAQSPTGYLFTDTGVHPFPLDGAPNFPPRTLLLFDENSPDQALSLLPGDEFVVQATSPRSSRYKDWAKQRRADFWVMQPWSGAEIAAEVNYINRFHPSPNTYSPQESFELVGPSTRTCLGEATLKLNPSDISDEAVIRDFGLDHPLASLFDSPSSLTNMLKGGDVDEVAQGAGFHRIFYAFPEPLQPSPYKRFSYHIPTPLVRRSLVALVKRQTEEKQLDLAAQFSSSPVVFGIFFEAHAINSILRSGITLRFQDSSIDIQKPSRADKYDGTTEIEPGVLYVPSSTSFPTLDAFLVTPLNQVVLFQATVSYTHAFKGNGVHQVVKSLKKTSTPITSLVFFFAFLTPTVEAGMKLSRSFAKNSKNISLGLQKLVGNVLEGEVALRAGFGTVDLGVVAGSFVESFKSDVSAVEEEVERSLMEES